MRWIVDCAVLVNPESASPEAGIRGAIDHRMDRRDALFRAPFPLG